MTSNHLQLILDIFIIYLFNLYIEIVKISDTFEITYHFYRKINFVAWGFH